MARGFILSSDALIASLILLSTLLVVANFISILTLSEKAKYENFEKVAFASSLSSAIIKTRNETNPSTGAAYYNEEKRRVESNVVDEELLSKIVPQSFGRYGLFGIYERSQDSRREIFFQSAKECIFVERFVIIRGTIKRKAVLGVIVCE